MCGLGLRFYGYDCFAGSTNYFSFPEILFLKTLIKTEGYLDQRSNGNMASA